MQAKAGQKRSATSSSSNTSNSNMNPNQILMNLMKGQAMLAMKNVQNNTPAWSALLQNMTGGGGGNQGQMAMLQAMLQANGQNNANAAMQQLALLNSPILQHMMALQANNIRMNANKSRK